MAGPGINVNNTTSLASIDKAISIYTKLNQEETDPKQQQETQKIIDGLQKAKGKIDAAYKLYLNKYVNNSTKKENHIMKMATTSGKTLEQYMSLTHIQEAIDKSGGWERVDQDLGNLSAQYFVSNTPSGNFLSPLFKDKDGKWSAAKFEFAALAVSVGSFAIAGLKQINAFKFLTSAFTTVYTFSPAGVWGLGTFLALKALKLAGALFSPFYQTLKQRNKRAAAIAKANKEAGEISEENKIDNHFDPTRIIKMIRQNLQDGKYSEIANLVNILNNNNIYTLNIDGVTQDLNEYKKLGEFFARVDKFNFESEQEATKIKEEFDILLSSLIWSGDQNILNLIQSKYDTFIDKAKENGFEGIIGPQKEQIEEPETKSPVKEPSVDEVKLKIKKFFEDPTNNRRDLLIILDKLSKETRETLNAQYPFLLTETFSTDKFNEEDNKIKTLLDGLKDKDRTKAKDSLKTISEITVQEYVRLYKSIPRMASNSNETIERIRSGLITRCEVLQSKIGLVSDTAEIEKEIICLLFNCDDKLKNANLNKVINQLKNSFANAYNRNPGMEKPDLKKQPRTYIMNLKENNPLEYFKNAFEYLNSIPGNDKLKEEFFSKLKGKIEYFLKVIKKAEETPDLDVKFLCSEIEGFQKIYKDCRLDETNKNYQIVDAFYQAHKAEVEEEREEDEKPLTQEEQIEKFKDQIEELSVDNVDAAREILINIRNSELTPDQQTSLVGVLQKKCPNLEKSLSPDKLEESVVTFTTFVNDVLKVLREDGKILSDKDIEDINNKLNGFDSKTFDKEKDKLKGIIIGIFRNAMDKYKDKDAGEAANYAEQILRDQGFLEK